MHLWIMFVAFFISSDARHVHPYNSDHSTEQKITENDVTVVDEKTGIHYNPYSKHHPGRHVCTNYRNVSYPVKTRQVFCKPTYKKYMVRCGPQWCEGVRLVYEKYHKEIVTNSNHTQIDYTCCPGWAQVTTRSHGCHKPVCARPCNHGGTCVMPDTCSCPPGHDGRYCETKVQVYSTSGCAPPCQNGGVCGPQNICICPPKHNGLQCQAPVLCAPPCNNGGTCTGETCVCPPGFNGAYCETTVVHFKPPCPVKCLNGGTATRKCTCSCRPGFTGKQCQNDVDECKALKPCDHICYNTPGSFKCHCKENFTLQKDGQSCRKESTAFEAKDLESQRIDRLDKRLSKLEQVMNTKSKNEVSKTDLEKLYSNIEIISRNVGAISRKLIKMDQYSENLDDMRNRLAMVEHKTSLCKDCQQPEESQTKPLQQNTNVEEISQQNTNVEQISMRECNCSRQ